MFNTNRLRAAVGETLREVGMLIAVFAPLDFLFSQGSGVAGDAVVVIATAGVLLMIGGILIGARE